MSVGPITCSTGSCDPAGPLIGILAGVGGVILLSCIWCCCLRGSCSGDKSPSSDSGGMRVALIETNRSTQLQAATGAVNAAPHQPAGLPPPPPPTGLPPGWSSAIDPSSGKIYYFNKTTSETSWDVPVGGKTD